MNNSDQEKQDRSTNFAMEDSTAMTIEFLRARLLSERSVSRSARQRADDLAQRVAELEEQLRIVSLQRMKAEKATADVLTILEGNGISDISETFDSSSDQDTPCECKVVNGRSKEEDNSVNSKVRNNESEEVSGSDFDFSRARGRSLSWKGRKDSPHSLEKYKNLSLRSSFTSNSSSPKHRTGKSCRQIRHKESRSVAEESKASHHKVDSIYDEVATPSDADSGMLGGSIKGEEEKMSMEQNASNGHGYNVYGEEGDMEKALEHQAQLIAQYEAMEKAQREWEEKFRENNSSTPDSCDPGNRSDITEERYEIKAPATDHAITIASQTNGISSEVEDVSKIQPDVVQLEERANGFLPSSHADVVQLEERANGFLPSSHAEVVQLEERESISTSVSKSSVQEFAFPMAKVEENQESQGNNYHLPPAHFPPHDSVPHCSHDSPTSQSVPSFPSNASGRFSNGKASGSQNELYALVPHKASDGLGSVLEALNKARQSLQRRLPLVAVPVGKSVEPSVPTTMPRDKMEVPVGCVGLFRLPTDFSVEANARANLLSSSAQSSLGSYYPDAGVTTASSNQFVSNPYLESWPNLSTEDQFIASQYVRNGSRIPTQKPYFDPYLDTGLPSSSRYSYPSYPINTSYHDLMPRMPPRESFSSSLPGRAVGMPSSNHFPLTDDNIRQNMYR